MTRYDVVVLDRDLPGVHGDEICRRLTARRRADPGPDAHRRRRAGGARGRASSSVPTTTWPSRSPSTELVARVRALGRRATPAAPPVLRGPATSSWTRRARAATRRGALGLTRKELGVLEVLLRAEGAVVSSEELLERVVGRERRPVHHDRPGHRDDPAQEARRARRDRATVVGHGLPARVKRVTSGRTAGAGGSALRLRRGARSRARGLLAAGAAPWCWCGGRCPPAADVRGPGVRWPTAGC